MLGMTFHSRGCLNQDPFCWANHHSAYTVVPGINANQAKAK